MRISDWSSDVCSSDLQADRRDLRQGGGKRPGCEAARAVRTVDPGRGRVRALQGRVRRQARRGRAQPEHPAGGAQADRAEIGRATCRERGWQYVYISGVAVDVKKKNDR